MQEEATHEHEFRSTQSTPSPRYKSSSAQGQKLKAHASLARKSCTASRTQRCSTTQPLKLTEKERTTPSEEVSPEEGSDDDTEGCVAHAMDPTSSETFNEHRLRQDLGDVDSDDPESVHKELLVSLAKQCSREQASSERQHGSSTFDSPDWSSSMKSSKAKTLSRYTSSLTMSQRSERLGSSNTRERISPVSKKCCVTKMFQGPNSHADKQAVSRSKTNSGRNHKSNVPVHENTL